MEWIACAALCSVAVSVLLKLSHQRGFNSLNLITWNYLTASVLCYVWFQPDFSQLSLSHTPWWLIVLLSLLLPGLFWLLAQSLRYAGLIATELAQRLSVVLSLTAAYALYQETFNELKILGIVLGIAAIILIILSKAKFSTGHTRATTLGYLLAVWLGYALVDILLKYTTGLGMQLALVLNLTFIGGFILCLALTGRQMIQHSERIMSQLGWGLCLGVLNFANIALYIQAHIALKNSPAIVFAGMNILVVLLGAILGRIWFKEQLHHQTIYGVILAVLSLISLAFALWN